MAVAKRFPASRGRNPDGVVIIDFLDSGNPLAERYTRSRRRAYAQRGWHVQTAQLDTLSEQFATMQKTTSQFVSTNLKGGAS